MEPHDNAMPRRPRQHEIETESQRAFESILPSSWYVRKMEGDYGIDLEVEIFEAERATGLTFRVQLKGTDKRPKRGRISRNDIKRSTLNYWRSLDVPVLVCVYSAPATLLYGRWAHSYDSYGARSQASGTVTFTFRSDNLIGPQFVAAIPTQVEYIRAVKTRRLRPPISLFLVPGSGISDHPAARIRSQLKMAADGSQGLVALTESEAMACRITIKNDTIRMALPTDIHTFTMHTDHESYSGHDGLKSFAADIMIGTSYVYMGLGTFEAAESLVRLFGPSSPLLRSTPLTVKFVDEFLEEGLASAGYHVIYPLIDAEPRSVRQLAESVLVQIYISDGFRSLSDTELAGMVDALRRRAEVERQEGRSWKSAQTLYNIGEMLRASGDYPEAIKLFDEACARDRSYERRTYFWRARGGLNYGQGRLSESESDYRKAIELGGVPEVPFLLSDVLLHQGRYADAAAVEVRDSSDDFYSLGERQNRRLLESVRSIVEIGEQERRTVPGEVFGALDGAPPDAIVDALRTYDALDPQLWYLLTRAMLAAADPTAFLASAMAAELVQEHPRLWALAVSFGVAVDAPEDVVDDLCDSGHKWCGTAFVDAVAEMHDEGEAEFSDEVIDRAYARAQAERPRWPRVLRSVADDGTYTTFELPISP